MARSTGLGLLLAASPAYAATVAANGLVHAANTGGNLSRWLLSAVGFMVAIGLNTVLAGSVGLLVFLNAINQMVLFTSLSPSGDHPAVAQAGFSSAPGRTLR